MGQVDQSLTLRQLLDYCSDVNSDGWETGWREFLRRYKLFIYKKLSNRCSTWNVPRLQLQLSETVSDIFSKVLEQLCKNECKSLRDFQARDNERMFLAWLASICNRCTSNYMKKYFKEILIDEDIGNFINQIRILEFDVRWELYELIVANLRKSKKRKRKNLERDINIFLLYTFADFSQSMILSIPHLKNIGYRVVDDVIYRMRQILKSAKNF